jgi:hypothetical protein
MMENTFNINALGKEAIKFFKHINSSALDITIIQDPKSENEVYITIMSKFDLVPKCYSAKINIKEE